MRRIVLLLTFLALCLIPRLAHASGSFTLSYSTQATCNSTNTPCTVTSGGLQGDATSANVVFNLPAATGSHVPITACKIDSSTNTVTLTPAGSDRINGVVNYVLNGQNQCVTLYDSATGSWLVRSEGNIGAKIQRTNGSTGTTLNKLFTTSNFGTAVNVTAGATSGALGICDSGCGTTGVGTFLVGAGDHLCVFDASVFRNDYVIISSTVNGDCADGGSTPPIGVETIGRVDQANATGAGTYTILFYGPDYAGTPLPAPADNCGLLTANGAVWQEIVPGGDLICGGQLGQLVLGGQEGLSYTGLSLSPSVPGEFRCTTGAGTMAVCAAPSDPATTVGDIPAVSAIGTGGAANTYGRIPAGALGTLFAGQGAGVIPSFLSPAALDIMQWTTFASHAANGTFTFPANTTLGVIIGCGAGAGGAGGGGSLAGGGGGESGSCGMCLAFAGNGNGTYTVTVATGGAAGTATPGAGGVPATSSSVSGPHTYLCSFPSAANGGAVPSGTTGGVGGASENGAFAANSLFKAKTVGGVSAVNGAGSAGGVGGTFFGQASICGGGGAGGGGGSLAAGSAGVDGCVFIGAF